MYDSTPDQDPRKDIRVLMEASDVAAGDLIRVRDHKHQDEQRKWHTVTVLDKETNQGTVILGVDLWPIAYVCDARELVEVISLTRRAVFRCPPCQAGRSSDTHTMDVTLEDFLDRDLLHRAGMAVVIIDPTPRPIRAYCAEHHDTVLDY